MSYTFKLFKLANKGNIKVVLLLSIYFLGLKDSLLLLYIANIGKVIKLIYYFKSRYIYNYFLNIIIVFTRLEPTKKLIDKASNIISKYLLYKGLDYFYLFSILAYLIFLLYFINKVIGYLGKLIKVSNFFSIRNNNLKARIVKVISLITLATYRLTYYITYFSNSKFPSLKILLLKVISYTNNKYLLVLEKLIVYYLVSTKVKYYIYKKKYLVTIPSGSATYSKGYVNIISLSLVVAA
ncbi:uncharacterized protein BBA_09782 [Beauveria bassiana ARSEF 2860]|uniref:Uncharacterized protein n=1 Tax=Beauveria bassiana (strain ARSEF 2860) TaxID=655819 RepID=J4UFH6_BEAB2|nr:uncharacterized protein BBA_09782 [Beauveria bassiana ARSEF 2860]EJP61277.1 hypothetical protein BBA_09782 [Beauveria bassiana ARSEF 2860]